MKQIIVKRIAACILFIAMFIGTAEMTRYLLVDDTKSYTRIMMHQMYNSDENIDIAFVGSSHVYRSLIPSVTDEGFGCYTFNAGTSSQYMDGSYALIRELSSHNEIKQIYLEMYCEMATNEAYKERDEMVSTYIISDYLRPSLRKVSYLLSSGTKEHWINSFIIARREWTKIFDPEYVHNLIRKKANKAYMDYEPEQIEGSIEYYVDKGFVANNGVVAEGTYINRNAYKKTDVDSLTEDTDWYKYLMDIISFCKRKQIKLTLFVAPEPEWTVLAKGNYQEYYDYIHDIAEKNCIPFYDFNLCKPTYFDANDRSLFKDEDHLNTSGALLFSEIFSAFFTGKIAENDLFYNSYNEKFMDETIMVHGVGGPKYIDETGEYEYFIISNRDKNIRYQIISIPEGCEPLLLQEYDENIFFSVPAGEQGVLEISWIEDGALGRKGTIEIYY